MYIDHRLLVVTNFFLFITEACRVRTYARLRSKVMTAITFLRFLQCWGSMTFWCGSGSTDPYLWLMDPDPTPFFIDFKDAKKIFFSYNWPTRTSSSVKNPWLTSLDSRCTSCLRQAVAARLRARCGLPSSRTRRGTRAPVAACESGGLLLLQRCNSILLPGWVTWKLMWFVHVNLPIGLLASVRTTDSHWGRKAQFVYWL